METTYKRHKNFPAMKPEALRAAREEMGLTQAEAAAKYELSLRTYKGYELGEIAIPGAIRMLTEYFLKDHRKI